MSTTDPEPIPPAPGASHWVGPESSRHDPSDELPGPEDPPPPDPEPSTMSSKSSGTSSGSSGSGSKSS
jgi:hypothetical protein